MIEREIKSEITCECGYTFNINEAKFCNGCRVFNCGCRGLSDLCTCRSYKTLVCPFCGKCACGKVDKWKKEGKIVRVENNRFDFVHKSLLNHRKESNEAKE